MRRPYEGRVRRNGGGRLAAFVALFLASLATNALASPLAAEAPASPVMAACAAVFGPPVDPAQGLFDANPHFALEVKLDDSGQLQSLSILPKSWLGGRHPAWDDAEDGELTESQYETLLQRLDGIQPRGPLLTRDEGVVVGRNLRRRDVYERAVVVTGDIADTDRPDDAPRAIEYVLVYPVSDRVP